MESEVTEVRVHHAATLSPARAAAHARVRDFSPIGVLGGAAITTCFVVGVLVIAGAAPTFGSSMLMMLAAVVMFLAGDIIISWASPAYWPGRLPFTFVCGVVATVLAQLFGVFVCRVGADIAFAAWSLPVLAVGIFRALRQSNAQWSRQDLVDLVVMAGIAVMVAFAFRNNVAVIPTLELRGALLDSDGVIHAGQLAQFADPLALHRWPMLFSDTGLPLYHYGFYMPAAAMMRLFDLPPLVAEAAILVPFGAFIAACAGYALAATLGGRLAGVLALALLFALPDGGHYGVRNIFFGFHSVMLYGPGAGYAIAAAAAALVSLSRCRAEGVSLRWAFLCLVMTAAIFQLRVHVLLLFLPSIVLSSLCYMPVVRRKASLLAVAGTATLVALGAAFWLVPALGDALARFSIVTKFLTVSLDVLGPTFYPGFFQSLLSATSPRVAVILGTAIVIVAILGVFVLIYPAAFIANRMMNGESGLDLFPLVMLFVYVFMIILSPSMPFADPYTELQHRPMVLVYFIFAVFIAVLSIRLLHLGAAYNDDFVLISLGTMLVAGLSIGLSLATGYRPDIPPAALASFVGRPTNPDIVPMSLELRRLSRPGQTLAVSGVERTDGVIDSCAEIASISGVPCYLSRPAAESTAGAAAAAVVRARLDELDRLAASPILADLHRTMREVGIDWYIFPGPQAPPFDPDGSNARMRNSVGFLYAVE
ncbi:hypothetical protein FHS55_001381 [Angulomicrobium tetraedrale]|uniref:Glycosyltransferase RgtA/B/C/D-like domain-containing protein n=1 Tax=Ancylobacter tetraedralis TaxID=217068 RepID=A0A839Z846_9HYPH|nr:hypothetical protein [Ancylobacter tetraedralis]MBB3770786.1 hypothetical protein [Ancylobacter tetraedralis]